MHNILNNEHRQKLSKHSKRNNQTIQAACQFTSTFVQEIYVFKNKCFLGSKDRQKKLKTFKTQQLDDFSSIRSFEMRPAHSVSAKKFPSLFQNRLLFRISSSASSLLVRRLDLLYLNSVSTYSFPLLSLASIPTTLSFSLGNFQNCCW